MAWNPDHPHRLLEEALQLWRATRDPALATRIEAWGRSLEPDDPEPTAGAFHDQWLQRAEAADTVHVGWLARTVDEKLGGTTDRQIRRALQRTERLERLDPDPRIASGLLEVIRRGRILPKLELDGTESEPLYARWIDLLTAQRDVRATPSILELLQHPIAPNATTRDLLERLLRAAHGVLLAVSPQEAADLPPLPDAPRPVISLQAVYDAPHDLGLRATLADQLQEQGDPYGTFVALQLAGRDPRRQSALLRAHRAAWLGPELDAVLANVTFVDGFLDSATVKKRPVDDTTPRRAAHDPRLSTVTCLRVGSGYGHHLLQLLASPHLRSLQVTDANKRHALLALSERAPLGVSTLHLGFPIRDHDRERLRALTHWPQLTTLHLPLNRARFDEGWATLVRCGLLDTLTTLWIEGHPDPAAVLVPENVARIERLGVGSPEDGVLYERKPRPTLTLTRSWSLPKLAALAKALDVLRVVFRTQVSATQWTRACDQLAPVEVVFAPLPTDG